MAGCAKDTPICRSITNPHSASVRMHAKDSPPFSAEGRLFEYKLDGYRMLATKEQLLTRNKKDANTWYPELLEALPSTKGSFILDGCRLLIRADVTRFNSL